MSSASPWQARPLHARRDPRKDRAGLRGGLLSRGHARRHDGRQEVRDRLLGRRGGPAPGRSGRDAGPGAVGGECGPHPPQLP